MIALDQVKELWQKRGAQIVTSETIGGWFVNSYATAAGRIKYHDEQADNIYWHAPMEDASGMLDSEGKPSIFLIDGSYEDPEETRKRAFELLVLADLAESMAP